MFVGRYRHVRKYSSVQINELKHRNMEAIFELAHKQATTADTDLILAIFRPCSNGKTSLNKH